MCGQRVHLIHRHWMCAHWPTFAEPKAKAQDANTAGTAFGRQWPERFLVASRPNRMAIGLRTELQRAGAEGPREPNDPPGRDRPEPPIHDPPPNPPEPDQPFGDPTPLPGNDPPDPPIRLSNEAEVCGYRVRILAGCSLAGDRARLSSRLVRCSRSLGRSLSSQTGTVCVLPRARRGGLQAFSGVFALPWYHGRRPRASVALLAVAQSASRNAQRPDQVPNSCASPPFRG